MKDRNFVIAEQIERMPGGFVVHVRWPYGPSVMGCGPVVCSTWEDVVKLLTKASGVSDND